MIKGEVLVIEDRQDWRDILQKLLEEDGFSVSVAATQDEAISLLEDKVFHLAIVDISLQFEDASDESGMNVLDLIKRSKLDRSLSTIVVSAYGTRRRMRRAFVNYEVDDFVPKDEFDSDEFLETVNRIYEEKIRYNPSLVILPNSLNFSALLANMIIDGKRIRGGSHVAESLAPEVPELLKRLFYRASSTYVVPIGEGFSGTGVLRAKPVYESSGVGASVVVKFGDKEQVEQEYTNYKKYVEGFIGQGRSSTVLDVRFTPHLGGIIYSFLGTDVQQLTSFEDYYRRHPTDQIKEVLSDLFSVTTANWYANRSPVQPLNIVQEYLQTFRIQELEQLEDHVFVGKLKQYRQQSTLQVTSLEVVELPHPFEMLRSREFIYFTTVCTTHGDLNANNLMVDSEQKTWLIDFYRTGPGHILRDCVQLEATLKYTLLQSDDIEERYKLEKHLNNATSFEEAAGIVTDLPAISPEIEKTLSIIAFVRQEAYRLVRVHGGSDFGEYQVAVAIHSLNLARMLSLTTTQRLHALIGASLALKAAL